MTEPKAFKDGVQFGWDSTSIKLAEECLRKYQYKMIEGWSPVGLSVHLRFGQHYASALEHFAKYLASGMDREDALIEVVQEALVDTWDRPKCEDCTDGAQYGVGGGIFPCPTCNGTMHVGDGSPWQSNHNTKTRENLIRTIVWYIDHFVDDPAKTVILGNGQAAVEHSFALPVDDGLVFSGHIDKLVNYAGQFMVMDQKTSGSTITARYFEGFKPDIQMSMYTFAGRMIYDMPVKGVIIDAAQIAVGFSRFERGMTFRTESELNEWYDNSMMTIQRARTATQLNSFPMNRTACGNYGGCEFQRICSRSPEVREQFLKGDFEKKPRWDPLTPR